MRPTPDRPPASRGRRTPSPAKPQAVPSNGVNYPKTKPPAGMRWVRVRRPDGSIQWVLRDKPKPAPQKPGRDRNVPTPPPEDGAEDPAPPEDDKAPDAEAEDDNTPRQFDDAYWDQRFPGLPDDVKQQIREAWDKNPNMTNGELVGVLKKTPWYQREFSSFEAGVKAGMFDEGAYTVWRNWKSSVDDAARRYGVDPETLRGKYDEWATVGWSQDRVEREFAADAYVKANRADVQYAAGAFGGGQLSDQDLSAFGRQQVGVTSDMGAQLQTRVQTAFQKLQRVFEGTLAVSELTGTVAQERRRRGDVGA